MSKKKTGSIKRTVRSGDSSEEGEEAVAAALAAYGKNLWVKSYVSGTS
jgi:hypothetical protein